MNQRILIVGGGVAGLFAAETAAALARERAGKTGQNNAAPGPEIHLFEAQPAAGKKLLAAGSGGLNLTRMEAGEGSRAPHGPPRTPLPKPHETMARQYRGGVGREGEMPASLWRDLLAEWDADATRAWAAGLGVETFATRSGRVYPKGLKAAHLLRAWLARLRKLGVQFHFRHRLCGLDFQPAQTAAPETARPPWLATFETPAGPRTEAADAVILALGGASWPVTGSDGGWVRMLEKLGVAVAPWEPANCGWNVDWPPELLAAAEGLPLKNITVAAGGQPAGAPLAEALPEPIGGELLITRHGLEGGPLYALGPQLRALLQQGIPPALWLDLKPDCGADALVKKLGAVGKRTDLLAEARRRWRLADAAFALLKSRWESRRAGGHGTLGTPQSLMDSASSAHPAPALARLAKALPVPLTGPRPLREAISSAGGVRWSELAAAHTPVPGGTSSPAHRALMLRRFPGLFVAGEMIDWEAPTGGYLLQGCLAMGRCAARGAAGFVEG